MTFCSTAALPGKMILPILHLWHRDFHMGLAGKFDKQMEALIQTTSYCRNSTKNKLLKLVNSMTIYFLFAGMNLNLIIQKKAPEKYMF